jgi:hypothetical protein
VITLDSLREMFYGREAYLVGGGARNVYFGHDATPRDWDVLVEGDLPDIPCGWRANSFGGRKYESLGLDVWTDSVGKYLREAPGCLDGLAIHLGTMAVLMTSEFAELRPVEGRFVRRKEGVCTSTQ